MIASPYDLDVHYAKNRTTTWIGTKVHLTETCEIGQPPPITHVETTTVPVADRAVLADVHPALKGKDPLPERHLVDAGSIAMPIDASPAPAITASRSSVHPRPTTNGRRAPRALFMPDQFSLDWENKIATCRPGRRARVGSPIATAITPSSASGFP